MGERGLDEGGRGEGTVKRNSHCLRTGTPTDIYDVHAVSLSLLRDRFVRSCKSLLISIDN